MNNRHAQRVCLVALFAWALACDARSPDRNRDEGTGAVRVSSPSAARSPTVQDAFVVAGQITEIALVAQCLGDENGALDAVALLNTPPSIEDVTISPGNFITTCQEATITIAATDPDGDDLAYAWELDGTPIPNTTPSLTLGSDEPGDFDVTVTITDVHGATTAQTLPLHVSLCSPVFAQTSYDAAQRFASEANTHVFIAALTFDGAKDPDDRRTRPATTDQSHESTAPHETRWA